MAAETISGLAEGTSLADDDEFPFNDRSDWGMSLLGTTKRSKWSTIKSAIAALFVPQTRTIGGVDLSANRSLSDIGVAWKKIGLVTASNQASIEFTGLSGYRYLRASLSRVVPVTNGVDLGVQVAVGGTYDTGANYAWRAIYEIVSIGVGPASGTYTFAFLNTFDNTSGKGASGTLTIDNFNQGATCYIHGTVYGRRGGAGSETVNGIEHTGTSARDKIRFLFSSGNIATGEILLEGME